VADAAATVHRHPGRLVDDQQLRVLVVAPGSRAAAACASLAGATRRRRQAYRLSAGRAPGPAWRGCRPPAPRHCAGCGRGGLRGTPLSSRARKLSMRWPALPSSIVRWRTAGGSCRRLCAPGHPSVYWGSRRLGPARTISLVNVVHQLQFADKQRVYPRLRARDRSGLRAARRVGTQAHVAPQRPVGEGSSSPRPRPAALARESEPAQAGPPPGFRRSSSLPSRHPQAVSVVLTEQAGSRIPSSSRRASAPAGAARGRARALLSGTPRPARARGRVL
jgi:hypothetical protein